jgi:hypothetical protein
VTYYVNVSAQESQRRELGEFILVADEDNEFWNERLDQFEQYFRHKKQKQQKKKK